MPTLPEAVPDQEYLLSLEAEELAALVLHFAKLQPQNGMVILNNFQSSLFGDRGYPRNRQNEIELAIAEAWQWLEVQGLLVPASGTNGGSGWRVLSRRAKRLDNTADLRAFARARRIDKSALNPRIAQSVWSAFMRGEFDVAAFVSMKAVEVAVRKAGGFKASDLGVPLMRAAFDEEKGPLTDLTAEKSERQARSHLFAGAIGSYKNALSHRDVNIDDPDEALEIVMLANHLLRIVDRRKAALAS